ncbi:MAG TPA: hypothetical protein DDW49_09585 [Deltaproteobacteria bacterium]|nr:MAG: hypothetical protein A2048_06895 [Deltaproteobacteria bacterium GWA2_45_12]HBF13614.1 hypothetical protein [Deltaproteobacteria bacterium]
MVTNDELKSNPMHLFKAFRCLDHTHDFLNGSFWMGNINYYKKIEDATRQDITEGESCYKKYTAKATENIVNRNTQPGYINCTANILNPIHLLCCSSPEVDLEFLKKKFGIYVVRINNPEQLLIDLNNFFSHGNLKTVGPISLKKVEYTKGNILPADPEDETKLIYTQKSPKFKPESEFRFIVTLDHKMKREDFLKIILNKRLDYVEQV